MKKCILVTIQAGSHRGKLAGRKVTLALRDGAVLEFSIGTRFVPRSIRTFGFPDRLIKHERPHFHVEAYEQADGLATYLYRIDFRGITSHLRVGRANVTGWRKAAMATPEEIIRAIKRSIEALSLKQFNNWENRLRKRKPIKE